MALTSRPSTTPQDPNAPEDTRKKGYGKRSSKVALGPWPADPTVFVPGAPMPTPTPKPATPSKSKPSTVAMAAAIAGGPGPRKK